MRRPILALDFDGVLHPDGCWVDRHFCKLPLLESWLRRRPAVDVVISSTWRALHPIDELRGHFAEDLRLRIIGATPIIRRDGWTQFDGEPPRARYEREAEIRRWLYQSADSSRPWAALDDQPLLFRPACRELVVCDRKVGVTSCELRLVDRLLGVSA